MTFYATHPFARRGLNPLDENGNIGCAVCGRPPSAHREHEVIPTSGEENKLQTHCKTCDGLAYWRIGAAVWEHVA